MAHWRDGRAGLRGWPGRLSVLARTLGARGWPGVMGVPGGPSARATPGARVQGLRAPARKACGRYGVDCVSWGPWAFLSEWARLGEDFVRDVDVRDGAPVTLGDGSPYKLKRGVNGLIKDGGVMFPLIID